MTSENHSLDIAGLSASYGGVPAVTDVSLRVAPGSIVTLIGANGAGKSTIIKCVCGLVKPIAGSIRLFGENITGWSPDRIVQRGIGIIPEGRRLFSEMTFMENLELGAYTCKNRVTFERNLERVLTLFPDLKDRLSTVAGTFSGGQQQMVAVARALMSDPKVLLLDEPTIGLSPHMVERIAGLILDISKGGVDILLVEQNAEVALEISHRAYILEAGAVIAEGDAKELAQSEEVQKAYLGT